MDFGLWHFAGIVFLAYWAICRSLRYRRANHIASKFANRDPYSLTIDEAQWVVEQITTLEMSKLSRLATAFALFRTYGIVTIAPLLMKYPPFSHFVLRSLSVYGCCQRANIK
jgi:phosphatidylglycerophosphatase A